jgi:hypothetical protein
MTLDKAYNEFRKAQQSFFDDEEPEKKPKEVAKPTPPETQQTPVQAVEPKIGKPEANAPASFEHTPAAMPKQTGASLENIAYAQHFMKELPREVQDWINTDLNNPDGRYHEFLKPEGLDLKSYFAAMDEDYVNRSQHKDVITDTLKHKTGAGKGLEDQQVLPGKNEAISEAKVEEMIDENDRDRWNNNTVQADKFLMEHDGTKGEKLKYLTKPSFATAVGIANAIGPTTLTNTPRPMEFMDENGKKTKADVSITNKGITVTFEKNVKTKGASTRVATIKETIVVPTTEFKVGGKHSRWAASAHKLNELSKYYKNEFLKKVPESEDRKVELKRFMNYINHNLNLIDNDKVPKFKPVAGAEHKYATPEEEKIAPVDETTKEKINRPKTAEEEFNEAKELEEFRRQNKNKFANK